MVSWKEGSLERMELEGSSRILVIEPEAPLPKTSVKRRDHFHIRRSWGLECLLAALEFQEEQLPQMTLGSLRLP